MANKAQSKLLVAAVVTLFSLLVWTQTSGTDPAPRRLLQYATNPSRSANVNKYCESGVSRDSLVDMSEYESAK